MFRRNRIFKDLALPRQSADVETVDQRILANRKHLLDLRHVTETGFQQPQPSEIVEIAGFLPIDGGGLIKTRNINIQRR